MSEPGRRDVWGDDPEERDAIEAMAEVEAGAADADRHWHDHPAVVPLKAVSIFIARNGKRVLITIAGFGVVLAGIALLVLPGPGWLLIFVGLSILATEYVWARHLLKIAKEKANAAKDAVLRRKPANPDNPDEAS